MILNRHDQLSKQHFAVFSGLSHCEPACLTLINLRRLIIKINSKADSLKSVDFPGITTKFMIDLSEGI